MLFVFFWGRVVVVGWTCERELLDSRDRCVDEDDRTFIAHIIHTHIRPIHK